MKNLGSDQHLCITSFLPRKHNRIAIPIDNTKRTILHTPFSQSEEKSLFDKIRKIFAPRYEPKVVYPHYDQNLGLIEAMKGVKDGHASKPHIVVSSRDGREFYATPKLSPETANALHKKLKKAKNANQVRDLYIRYGVPHDTAIGGSSQEMWGHSDPRTARLKNAKGKRLIKRAKARKARQEKLEPSRVARSKKNYKQQKSEASPQRSRANAETHPRVQEKRAERSTKRAKVKAARKAKLDPVRLKRSQKKYKAERKQQRQTKRTQLQAKRAQRPRR